MKSSTAAKIGLMIALAGGTSLTTLAVLRRPAAGQAGGADPARTTTVETPAGAAKAAGVAGSARPAQILGRATMKEFHAAGDAAGIHVACSTALSDADGVENYVWRLRVFRDAGGRALSDRIYAEQAFKIDPSGSMEPGFAETLPAGPGKYRVELTLNCLPGHYKSDRLLEKKGGGTFVRLRSFATVDVP